MVEELDAQLAHAILSLDAASAAVDGTRQLSEQVVFNLAGETAAGQTIRHVLVLADDGVVLGYAQVAASGAFAVAELVVAPGARRRGIGRRLVETLEEVGGALSHQPPAAGPPTASATDQAGEVHTEPEIQLRFWAHTLSDAAAAFAEALGLSPVRRLLLLQRSLAGDLPEPRTTPGYAIDTFRGGKDDDEVLRVNAEAFADHPEQGRWGHQDLEARLSSDWFDPLGFFVARSAEDPSRLLGFHWTKVHRRAPETVTRDSGTGIHDHTAHGEIYVLAVDPEAQGSGLGLSLALTGLAYLRTRGLGLARLYVESDNSAALGLYARLGFTVLSQDVMFARSDLGAPTPSVTP